MVESIFYEKTDDDCVRCLLCNHYCKINNGKSGICGVRRNINGVLYTQNFGNLVAQSCDPIEKKPLYHFLPGSLSYSIASEGCNFKCRFCQNWQISQKRQMDKSIRYERDSVTPPEVVVENALNYGCRSISITYTEPTLSVEYILELGKIAQKNNLKIVLVSNGYMTVRVLNKLSAVISAYNIDLKSFNNEFYKLYCNASLDPVIETIRAIYKSGIWLELTTLVLSGINDSKDELQKTADFIASIDNRIPWHISRFFPHYKMTDVPVTNKDSLQRAMNAGIHSGLRYLYLGNTSTENKTTCSHCGKIIIKRNGYNVETYVTEEGRCLNCGEKGYWVWK